jgi:predicted O-methyltransferase YrrM
VPTRPPGAARVAGALLRDARRTGGTAAVRHLGRRWLRYGDYLAAERLLRSLPTVRLGDLTDLGAAPAATYQELFAERDGWSRGVLERLALAALVTGRGVTSVLELGTFDGGTTRLLAEAVGPHGRVTTVDLPEEQLAQLRLPPGYGPGDVGREHRAGPHADRVRQLRCDTAELTAERLGETYELVLVDAAHDYPAGRRDAALALSVLRPGGLVVFDDFVAHWGGLVRGIVEATGGRALRRLEGTHLGVVVPG